MSYERFIGLRQTAWSALEQDLERAQAEPRRLDYEALENLSFRYRQALHDFALAQSRFPGSAVVERLRRVVLAATHFLQRDSGEQVFSLRRFILELFPKAMREVSGAIAVSVLVFVAATLLGAVLAAVEPQIGTFFLPKPALDNLKNGELWTESIFSVTPGSVASTQIATNNLSVCLIAWAGGTLAGIGALYALLNNGLMLGAISVTTAHFSMFGSLGAFIAAHGPLELTLIMVSAGAGLHVGWALVAVDDRPRAVRLTRAGRDSLIVLFGSLPWIVLLGIVEGYISPVDLPIVIKLMIGAILELSFLAWVFLPTSNSASPEPT